MPLRAVPLPAFLVAADLSIIHVDANVTKTDIGEIKPGDKARSRLFRTVPSPER